MTKILAIGSSQLVGFKRGIDLILPDKRRAFDIDFVGMWETGFGYIELDKLGNIVAPDIVPPLNNPSKVNLKRDWRIWGLPNHKTPLIHNYDFIFVIASPCKYFAPLYYSNPRPILLSRSMLEAAIFSCYMDCASFDHISPWMFRISPVIKALIDRCPDKIVFIGSPLPISGEECTFIEPLRRAMKEHRHFWDAHMENIDTIEGICRSSLICNSASRFKIALPPSDVCCDDMLSTRRSFYKGNHNAWHANTDYWGRVVEHLCELNLLPC